MTDLLSSIPKISRVRRAALNWKELPLTKKFWTIFGVIGLGFAILIYAALSGARATSASIQNLKTTNRLLQMGGDLKAELANLRTTQRGVIMYTSAHLPGKVQDNVTGFRASTAKVRELKSNMRSLLNDPGAIQDVDAIDQAVTQYDSAFTTIIDQCKNNDTTAALATAADVGAAGNEFQARAADLMNFSMRQASDAAEQADKTQSRLSTTAWVVAFLALAIMAVSVFVVHRISIALRLIAEQMGDGAAQVTSAAAQISSSSQILAQGSSEQAASLEETSASSEEMNSMARKNTDCARSMATLVAKSEEAFATADRQLESMIVSMDEINQSSDKISKIIKVIDEIAFQTNILALNAAVEAARAGEAGMGFAVVADEVRNLAQRAGVAAKDTSALIEESIAKAGAGKSKTDEVATTIRAIKADQGKIRELVSEVRIGSEEQSRGFEQVTKAITQMEQVTQTTAANAEESAAAAEELNAQSEALKHIVERLQLMIDNRTRRGLPLQNERASRSPDPAYRPRLA